MLYLPGGAHPSAKDLRRMLGRTRAADLILSRPQGGGPSSGALALLRIALGVAVENPEAPFLVKRKALEKAGGPPEPAAPFPALDILGRFLRKGLRAEEVALGGPLLNDGGARAGLIGALVFILRVRLGLGSVALPRLRTEPLDLKKSAMSWASGLALGLAAWAAAWALRGRNMDTLALMVQVSGSLAALFLCGGRAENGFKALRTEAVTGEWGRAAAGLGIAAAAFAAARYTWIVRSDVSDTLLVIFGAAALLGYVNSGPTSAAVAADGPEEGRSRGVVRSEEAVWLRAVMVFGAVWLAVQGCGHWARDRWPEMAWRFCASYFLFHLSRRWGERGRNPGPGLSRWVEGALLAVILVSGAGIRFHQIGAVPQGMYSDEVLILEESINIAAGDRPTFMTKPEWNQGSVAVYLSAFCYKFFGQDLRAFRLTSAIGGLGLVVAVWLLGRSLFGAWAALGAAAFVALELCPVAFSRIHYMEQIPAAGLCLALAGITWGLRLRNFYVLALGGVMAGFCLNTYLAGRGVLLMIPMFAAALMISREEACRKTWRPALVFCLGFVLGTAPLLHWFMSPPVHGGDLTNFDRYSLAYRLQHITPGVLQESIPAIKKLDAYAKMALNEGPKMFALFVSRGPQQMFHMLQTTPVISKLGLMAAAAGFLACLARFRSAAWGFLPLWFVVGLLPGMVTHSVPDPRRGVLSLPAAALMAGLGLALVIDAAAGFARGGKFRALLGAALLAGFGFATGKDTYRRYFFVINQNPAYLDFNRANSSAWARALFKETRNDPAFHVSYKRVIQESLLAPFGESYDRVVGVLNPNLPWRWMHENPETFSNGSLLAQLRSQTETHGSARTGLVSLSPFYSYLEPVLSGKLGGRLAQDVKVVRTPLGVCVRNLEILPTEDSLVRIWRLPPLDPAKLEALKAEISLPVFFDSLVPPPALGSAESLSQEKGFGPATRSALQGYWKSKAGWRAGATREVRLLDPYFWTLGANVHQDIRAPFRLRVRWLIQVPADGDYVFGANVSHDTGLKVDGREVLAALVSNQNDLVRAQTGLFGPPVHLTAGKHLLEGEQVVLNFTDVLLHEFRLLWKTPDGKTEPLPLALLSAAP